MQEAEAKHKWHVIARESRAENKQTVIVKTDEATLKATEPEIKRLLKVLAAKHLNIDEVFDSLAGKRDLLRVDLSTGGKSPRSFTTSSNPWFTADLVPEKADQGASD